MGKKEKIILAIISSSATILVIKGMGIMVNTIVHAITG